MFGHLSVPSNHGLDQRLYGLSGVKIFPGELWVVLELEWSPRTPPVKFCRDRLTSLQPHPLIFPLFLAYAGAPSPSCLSSWLPQPPLSAPSPSFPSSWLPQPPLSALSPSFPSSWQWPLSWFRRRTTCLFFSCILDVMNTSLSCCIMIAW